ncbi:Predicted nuclease of the RNAse H fold, HicB family [Paramicrobacterium humi]|uniref:Predicted nuclease of the RNAse H fold, HicB family n=1 Tax=Paramicrobacterium humi TaxID=640635 RepID=A0A1H4KR87_9MICO|nr:type II toxin-antitoxin system HicB family antitoxin [Microbacterium humi]SEB60746.1 Predicted nuclease of the RNAse H fold, HicB family [Microbacterium humi]
MAAAADRYAYRVLWSGEDDAHIGLVAEFPSLSWIDADAVAALIGIRQLVADVLDQMVQGDEPIPAPLSERRYSGAFKLRIPPELHRTLAIEAAEQNVSLNRLINMRLGATA